MITEAIWEEKKYQKGSTRPAIRNFIVNHYDVDEDKLKSNLSSTITKMLEESDGGYPLLVRVGDNYKLSPEWRKEWTKKYGKKQTKRKRRKKASDEPLHPRNGYLFYSKEVRKRRQDQHPDKSFPELTRLIADEWKNLPSKKRKKYDEMAEADRERYKKEMKAYKAKKKRERARSSGSDSESSSPRKRSRSRRSESSDESKRSPNKRRRRQSESDSGSKDKKKKTDSELKRSKANSDDEGSRGGKDKKSDKKN
jgi:hypothetical protein